MINIASMHYEIYGPKAETTKLYQLLELWTNNIKFIISKYGEVYLTDIVKLAGLDNANDKYNTNGILNYRYNSSEEVLELFTRTKGDFAQNLIEDLVKKFIPHNTKVYMNGDNGNFEYFSNYPLYKGCFKLLTSVEATKKLSTYCLRETSGIYNKKTLVHVLEYLFKKIKEDQISKEVINAYEPKFQEYAKAQQVKRMVGIIQHFEGCNVHKIHDIEFNA